MKNLSVEYRLAVKQDIDQLVRLRGLMQLEANEFKTEDITNEFNEKVKAYFLMAIPSKKYYGFIALINNKIIGTAGVCFYERPPSLSGGTGLAGYVANVFVEKDFRKKGIGKRMMYELNLLARELKADKLHLGSTSDGLSMYKAIGYKKPRFENLEIRFPFGDLT